MLTQKLKPIKNKYKTKKQTQTNNTHFNKKELHILNNLKNNKKNINPIKLIKKLFDGEIISYT